MGTYEYKKESTIILACIILILTFYCFWWFIKSILNKLELFSSDSSKREKMKKIFKSNKVLDPDDVELFSNGNSSKREQMKRIYKSDEVLDPDEIVMSSHDTDDCDDPDGTCGTDPDS